MLVNDCRVRFRYHSRCPLQWHYWLVGGGRGGRLLRDGSEHKDFQIWIKKLNFSLKAAQNVESYNPKLLKYPCCKNVLSKTSGRALKGCLSSLTGSVGLSVAPRSCAATTQGAQKQTSSLSSLTSPEGSTATRLEGRGKEGGSVNTAGIRNR